MCEKEETLPITNDLPIFKNSDFQFTVEFLDTNDAEIDWTGVVFIGEVRASDDTSSTLILSFSFDAGAADGLVVGRSAKAVNELITAKRGYYDVKATQGGQEFPIIQGDVLFEKGNTE